MANIKRRIFSGLSAEARSELAIAAVIVASIVSAVAIASFTAEMVDEAIAAAVQQARLDTYTRANRQAQGQIADAYRRGIAAAQAARCNCDL